MYRLMFLMTWFAFSCTGDELDETAFAIDSDGNGTVDCTDLDHVVACIHHPDSHVCAHADFNGDGVVDDRDAHDIHHALAAAHHECAAPDHHEPDGHHVSDHPGDHGDGHHDDGHHDGEHATDHDADGAHDGAVH